MFLTGITHSYFEWYNLVTLSIVLTSNGASTATLGALTLTAYPSVLRFAAAPFVDTYYIEKIGRRKTWMFLMSLAMSLISFYQSFYITEWVET